MLVFSARGKPEYPGENLSEQSKEPTNLIHRTSAGQEVELALTTARALLPFRLYFFFQRLNLPFI